MPLPISMHTGQIIMLTKMLTSSDLRSMVLKPACLLSAGALGHPIHIRQAKAAGTSLATGSWAWALVAN